MKILGGIYMNKQIMTTGILMTGFLLMASVSKSHSSDVKSGDFTHNLSGVVAKLSTTTISESQAKSIAFAHAGVSESEVSFVKVEFDYDDGIPEYEVEFYVGNVEYEYEIHGTTGAILGFDKDIDDSRPSTTTPSTNLISETEAKAIALSHAGVSESEVTFAKVKLDYEDEIPEYEVEFYVGNMEYDYEIHGTTGAILSFDREMETSRPNIGTTTTPNSTLITGAEAKAIALSHAGFSESEVTFVKVKLDYDDGIPEYEVEFYVGNMEYDYEIHGTTGAILEFDQEMETSRPTTNTSGIADWAVPFCNFVSPQIMPDISESNYESNSNRGLIAQSIYNMQGNGELVQSSHTLEDVGDYQTAINWCYENNIMKGLNSITFGTENEVKREEFALILQQLASYQGKNVTTDQNALIGFTDSSTISSWALDGMGWAVKNDLMNGSNQCLNPTDPIKRVEVAVMLSAFTDL